ncbi:hypothetical protein EG328_002500 [Venturia inaequalis]|uniref:Uncharacterized protein n=1 Tax=Venturia inaequalis TaxID=5025 RepID=A0A8H3VEY0_VENIN|nr:hypothetical protein EG328_002500 [Venturia inaequalis]
MPATKFSNDIDFVPHDKPKKAHKGDPPKPLKLPDFDPLRIQNCLRHSQHRNLPDSCDRNIAIDLWDLFFTPQELDKFVEYTNKNAELNPYHETLWDRKWTPITNA